MKVESVTRFAARIDLALRARVGCPAEMLLKDAMRDLVSVDGLLDKEETAPDGESYARHILYADPKGRFTLLAIVWLPGQFTPVHGHTAWGVVGVYAGTPTEVRFVENGGQPEQSSAFLCRPGDVETISIGTEEMHRIVNASAGKAITLHCYGRDLVDDPCSINIVVAE